MQRTPFGWRPNTASRGPIKPAPRREAVRCITLRENTERPVTVTHGTNEIVGLDAAKIRNGVDTVLAGKWKAGCLPQFWDGHSAQRIVDILTARLLPVVK